MLLMIMAGSALIAAPQPVQQNAASQACLAAPVAVSFEMKPDGKAPAAKPTLPTTRPQNRDPAQALPECREEPVKRRKRKNDYPLA